MRTERNLWQQLFFSFRDRFAFIFFIFFSTNKLKAKTLIAIQLVPLKKVGYALRQISWTKAINLQKWVNAGSLSCSLKYSLSVKRGDNQMDFFIWLLY